MKSKMVREIYALDYAVSSVLHTIDEQLLSAGLGWTTLGQSFCYEVSDRLSRKIKGVLDQKISIFPVRWPAESYIYCRIINFGNRWNPEEGVICARHLPQFDTEVSFRFYTGCPSFITPRGQGRKGDLNDIHEKIREAARKRRPDLVGKPGHDL